MSGKKNPCDPGLNISYKSWRNVWGPCHTNGFLPDMFLMPGKKPLVCPWPESCQMMPDKKLKNLIEILKFLSDVKFGTSGKKSPCDSGRKKYMIWKTNMTCLNWNYQELTRIYGEPWESKETRDPPIFI